MDSSLPTLLIFHPYDELYGSDRMVATVVRAVKDHYRCVVVLPADGLLADLVRDAGADVRFLPMPVVRKALLAPAAFLKFAVRVPGAIVKVLRLIRQIRPATCYVNTIAIPVVLLACRLSGVRTVCHTHEAENGIGRVLEIALTAPLFLSHDIVAISRTAAEFTCRRFPALLGRITVVYNCVSIPDRVVPLPQERPTPARMVLLGRWSERKGTDLAIAAAGLLKDQGVDVTLDVVGGIFPGYEWFEEKIRAQVAELGLGDTVALLPFTTDPAPVYESADVVLVPSRSEPFGLVAVEGMARARVVVAADVDGLSEIMEDAPVNWTFEPGSAEALAASIAACLRDWPASLVEAQAARDRVEARFGEAAFARQLVGVLEGRDAAASAVLARDISSP